MEMRLCPNNHYYDQSTHAQCPYCNGSAAAPISGGEVGKTMPLMSGGSEDIGKTMPVRPTEFAGKTEAAWGSPPPGSMDDGRTRAIIREEIGLDPVAGWLVCTEGTEKGRDYRMHSDNNFIGRAENMDITIRNDDTVSRVNHAVISYDSRDKTYYFAQGSGRGIVRVNGKAVLSTVELTAYDKIEIGSTKFIFVPLCGEGFDWLV